MIVQCTPAHWWRVKVWPRCKYFWLHPLKFNFKGFLCYFSLISITSSFSMSTSHTSRFDGVRAPSLTIHMCCIIFHSYVKLHVVPVVSIIALDQFYDQLSACLYESASSCIPTIFRSLNSTCLAGWNDSVELFKSHANFCTSFGVKLIVHLADKKSCKK